MARDIAAVASQPAGTEPVVGFCDFSGMFPPALVAWSFTTPWPSVSVMSAIGLIPYSRLVRNLPGVGRRVNGTGPGDRNQFSWDTTKRLTNRRIRRRVVPTVGYDPTSPGFQAGAISRSAAWAFSWSARQDSNLHHSGLQPDA